MMSAACDDNIAWTGSLPVDPKGWKSLESLDFQLDPEAYKPEESNRFARMTAIATGDTVRRLRGSFHPTISLRYREDCNTRELRLVAEHLSLESPTHTDTLYVRLFDDAGRPTGSGKFGIHEAQIPLPDNITITPGYILSIHPVEYATPPSGITDLTLILRR